MTVGTFIIVALVEVYSELFQCTIDNSCSLVIEIQRDKPYNFLLDDPRFRNDCISRVGVGTDQSAGPQLRSAKVPGHNADHVFQLFTAERIENRTSRGPRWLTCIRRPLDQRTRSTNAMRPAMMRCIGVTARS